MTSTLIILLPLHAPTRVFSCIFSNENSLELITTLFTKIFPVTYFVQELLTNIILSNWSEPILYASISPINRFSATLFYFSYNSSYFLFHALRCAANTIT